MDGCMDDAWIDVHICTYVMHNGWMDDGRKHGWMMHR
jgi:hypothetical protein